MSALRSYYRMLTPLAKPRALTLFSYCGTLTLLAGPLPKPGLCITSTSNYEALLEINCSCRTCPSLLKPLSVLGDLLSAFWNLCGMLALLEGLLPAITRFGSRTSTSLHEPLLCANFTYKTPTSLQETLQDDKCTCRTSGG